MLIRCEPEVSNPSYSTIYEPTKYCSPPPTWARVKNESDWIQGHEIRSKDQNSSIESMTTSHQDIVSSIKQIQGITSSQVLNCAKTERSDQHCVCGKDVFSLR